MNRTRLLGPVLVVVTLVASVVSSLGAPLIPTVATTFGVPLDAAQWSLTATLLVGAVSAPVLGRLGDGPRRRPTLVVGLLLVSAGGATAALATGLGVLVVGRAVMGVGLGLVPLTMAAARDHLPAQRSGPLIALLSVCGAAGVGAGYPISGFVADAWGLSAAFWFGAVAGLLALAAVLVVVPPSTSRGSSPLDVLGAVLLGAGLVALLLGIAQGEAWGWAAPEEIALFVAALVLFGAWVRHQVRTPHPLVELRLLRRPAVLTGDACAIVLGVAMYALLSAVTSFVQTPTSAGYGFGASVVVAGLVLVPFSIVNFSASRALPWLTAHLGARLLLPAGCLLVAVSATSFALFHDALWQAFAMMALLGAGLGVTFAAIPGLVVRAVPESETGSAMGFYQVVRYIGFSLGSAIAAAVLAARTPSSGPPEEAGYVVVMWVAVGVCVLAAVVAWVVPGRMTATAPAPAAVQDAELGGAGLIGVEEAVDVPLAREGSGEASRRD